MAELGLVPQVPPVGFPVAQNGVVSLEDLYPELAQRPDPFPGQGAQGGVVRPSPPQVVSITLDGTQQSRLLAQLREHYKEAMDGNDEKEHRRAQRTRRFLADPSLRDGLQPWTDAPQVFLSVTRTTIERFVVEAMNELLPDYERVVLKGIGDEDAQVADQKQRFFRWALEMVNHFRVTLREVMQDAYTHSLGIMKVFPKNNTFPGWLAPEDEQAFGPLLTLLKKIIAIESVDEMDLLIPPDATGLQYPECRYLAHRLYPHTIDDFDDMRQRGFQLKPAQDSYHEVETDHMMDESTRLGFTRDGMEPTQWHRGRVEMAESYELFDVDNDGVREFIVVHWFPDGHYGDIDGGGQLARILLLKDALPQQAFPRPMWPFAPVRAWAQPRQLRGMNVPDRIETHQDVLNRLVEQCLHQGEIEMLPFFFYNAALTGELPDLTQIKPGQGVPIDTGGNVVFKPSSSHNQHYAELMNLVRNFVEEDTGVTAANQGRNAVQPNAPRTVGGLALLLQEGNKGRKAMIEELADQVAEPLKLAFALWQTHVPSSFSIPLPDTAALEQRLLQGDGGALPLVMMPMQGQDLAGPFDLTLSVNPDALIEQQKQVTMAEKLDMQLQGYPLGRRALWKHVYESFGLQEFDQFWPEEVARLDTMLLILQKDMALGQVEAALSQMAQAGIQPPPESTAILQKHPGEPGAAPQPHAPQVPDIGMLMKLLQQATGTGGGPGQAQGSQGIPQTLANTVGQANNTGAQLTQGI